MYHIAVLEMAGKNMAFQCGKRMPFHVSGKRHFVIQWTALRKGSWLFATFYEASLT
jgi:hypothetical protein